jgi:hypothetical protein
LFLLTTDGCEAHAFEKQTKEWHREKKKALIGGRWNEQRSPFEGLKATAVELKPSLRCRGTRSIEGIEPDRDNNNHSLLSLPFMQYPKDKYLIPIFVPAIVLTVEALNNEPLSRLVMLDWFWKELIAGIIIAGVIWLFVRFISIRLDKKVQWKKQFNRRLLLQALFGWTIPSLILFILCWMMFEWIIGQPMFETLFPYYEFPFSVLVVAGINGYYLIYKLLENETVETSTEEIQPGVTQTTLFAYKGPDRFPLHHGMIDVVIKNAAYLDVYTSNGTRLSMTGTMDSLEKVLPYDVFFRVNRQVIMHAKSIKSFRSIENGKIEINCGLEGIEPPIVSQKKAAEFRKWMEVSFAKLN